MTTRCRPLRAVRSALLQTAPQLILQPALSQKPCGVRTSCAVAAGNYYRKSCGFRNSQSVAMPCDSPHLDRMQSPAPPPPPLFIPTYFPTATWTQIISLNQIDISGTQASTHTSSRPSAQLSQWKWLHAELSAQLARRTIFPCSFQEGTRARWWHRFLRKARNATSQYQSSYPSARHLKEIKMSLWINCRI